MLQPDVDLNKLLALSYVYVSRERVHPRNVFGGFLPFILAVAEPAPGRAFEPTKISTRLRDAFAWPVGGDFVSLYVDDFLRHGLIERGDDEGFVWTSAAVPPDQGEAKAAMEQLSEAFYKFSSELAGPMLQNRSREERLHDLANALVSNRLFSEDALESFAGRDDDPAESEVGLGTDYVCARFVRHCHRHDPPNYNALVTLSQLGVICQLATYFARPPTTEKTTAKLMVALDGPFLVDLLGFSGNDRRSDAALTIKLARDRKAKIVLFTHCLDEARDVVRGVLSYEPSERYGPTAAALRDGAIGRPILDAFVQTPRRIVEGTKLVDEIISPADRRFRGTTDSFNQEDWDILFGALSGWKELAAIRDCNSVRDVMRLRGDIVSSNVWQSKVTMLSSNVHFARIAKHVCVQRGLIDDVHVGPVISRFQLAAMLWLAGGHEEKIEIVSTHLLSAASALLTRDRTLIRKVQEYAAGVEQQRAELVQAFVGTSLSYEFLQDATLGGVRPVDEHAVSKVMDRLVQHGRDEGAIEEKKKSAAVLEAERMVVADAQRLAEAAAVAAKKAEEEVAQAHREREDALHQAQSQEALALREMDRVKKVERHLRGLLDRREQEWSSVYGRAKACAMALRWLAAIVLLLLVGWLTVKAATLGVVSLIVMLGALGAIFHRWAVRLIDHGRDYEKHVAAWLATRWLDGGVRKLNDELGYEAPPVNLVVDTLGARIGNKDEIVAALVG